MTLRENPGKNRLPATAKSRVFRVAATNSDVSVKSHKRGGVTRAYHRGVKLLPAVLLFFALASSRAALAQDSVEWTKDGRWLIVQSGFLRDAMSSRDAIDAFDAWTGELMHLEHESSSCMTGEPSEGDAPVADCRAEQDRMAAEWGKTSATFLKAHAPRTDAVAAPLLTVDGAANCGSGAKTLTLTLKSPERTLRVDCKGVSEPVTVRAFASSDKQWVVAVYGIENGETRVAALSAHASVDLLNAGKASRLGPKLEKAGFPAAHQGTSRDAHARPQVFAKKGFEDDAKRIAAALGWPADSVAPLTWATPWAITVVAVVD